MVFFYRISRIFNDVLLVNDKRKSAVFSFNFESAIDKNSSS
jgi:hypothetical protein